MYEELNNASIFKHRISHEMKIKCHDTYNAYDQTKGIKAALRCAWNIAQEARQVAKDSYDSDDYDDSLDSDEDLNDPYCSRGITLPDVVYEIECSYEEITKFLVYTQSIPPIDMGLRCHMIARTTSFPCFCPFGKVIAGTVGWFDKEVTESFKRFFEQKCKKDKFNTFHDLLAHCDSKTDWYHSMYSAYLKTYYCLPAKQSRKRKYNVKNNSRNR